MEGLRYANIGIAVGAVIIIGGGIAFRDAGEGALQAVALIGFFSALAVFSGLASRAKRRERKRIQ
jgi:predicted MFS family arabinose efflux permease